MPVLSQYWFHNGFFSGPFDVFNEPYPDGGWAWISNGSSSAATLAWNRPDGEHAVDLAAQLNTGDVLAIVDKAVPGAIGQVQKVLDDKLAVLASFTFSTMYYLPGSGTSSQGDHAENADTDLAVAVLS